jgi:outer membrane receptor protein involved in Fe transport
MQGISLPQKKFPGIIFYTPITQLLIMRSFIRFGCMAFITCHSLPLFSQTIIQGVIATNHDKGLQNANVLLVNGKDSTLVKGTVSDANGKYSFENIKPGSYRIMGSFTGMEAGFSDLLEVNAGKKNLTLPTLILIPANTQLGNVTVTARKPMFEQQIDRMVINVKNSVTDAGGTALDVLEKSPGVIVNRQNNSISINGKQGVVVMINGKINYMPMDALVQLLEGISAGNIEKIELLTTPPSKYDANGNAGYINIVLLNNPFQGLNGSYYLTGGYSRSALAGTGMNFNFRSGKVNLFGSYDFNYDPKQQTSSSFLQMDKGANTVTQNSSGLRNGSYHTHNLRMGIDYQLDTANTIGVLVSAYDNLWAMTAHNDEIIQLNNSIDTTIGAIVTEKNHWQNLMTNLNFQHTFKPGKTLYLDANYIYYKDNNPISYTNNYFNSSKQLLFNENLRTGKLTPINIYVLSADYTSPIGKKIIMETGAKMTNSKFTNNINVDQYIQNTWVPDNTLSANYLLNETVGAAYASFNINLSSKTSLKGGLRYEYTRSNLGTTTTANIVDRKYGEFFPTFYISQKLDDNHSLNFSYSRRITRPTFNDLAPFTIFFDPKTFFSGNPALQPSISNSVQASYLFKKFIFSVSYTYEKYSIEGFQVEHLDSITNILYLTAKNFDYEQYLSSSLSLPISLNNWWAMQTNINGDWRQINTTYNKQKVQLQLFDYNINSTQRFSLPNDFTFELTGMYYSPSFFGTYKLDPVFQVDAGIQKKFKNKKDILRLTGNDIFNSGTQYNFKDFLPIEGTTVAGKLNFGMVAYKITFTHNFGNKALKDKREHSTHAEEELNRVHN